MTFKHWLTPLKHEPLVHFLFAGLMLFAYFAWRGDDVDPESRTITITEEQAAGLATGWTQTWQRPPTRPEMDGLIRDWVKEEIYYREGLRLGLDQNDEIIRRRIRSKMEFLASSELESQAPGDAALQALLDLNPQKYATQVRYSFDQVYFAAIDDAEGRRRAASALVALGKGGAWKGMGDSISLPQSLENKDRDQIARDFGDAFAGALSALEPGDWTGPVSSGFGLHLVRVRKVEASAKPLLNDVRQRVENDWRSATIKAREAKAYQTLLDGYTVQIAQP